MMPPFGTPPPQPPPRHTRHTRHIQHAIPARAVRLQLPLHDLGPAWPLRLYLYNPIAAFGHRHHLGLALRFDYYESLAHSQQSRSLLAR